MFALHGDTVPFHFIWVSLSLVCCFRSWSLRPTVIVTIAVCAVTGLALAQAELGRPDGWGELAEVPLMASMFAVMVAFARRRQEAVSKLRRAAARERAFLREASHQLRTPITVAQGHVELIREASNGTQAGRDAEVVFDELGRLATISDNLLRLATSGDPRFLSRRPVHFEKLLRTTVARWSAAVNRDWELVVSANGTLLADEERLRTALDALVENAVNATAPEDRIAIHGASVGRTAIIEVVDSGAGLPAEEIEHVLEPFVTIHTGAKPQRGTGLGLPIVKAIVEAHRGSIEVFSELGKGTTVQLRLDGFRASEPRVSRALLARTGADRLESGNGVGTVAVEPDSALPN